MTNSDPAVKKSPYLNYVFLFIIVLLVAVTWFLYNKEQPAKPIKASPVVAPSVTEVAKPVEPLIAEVVEKKEPEVVEEPLPVEELVKKPLLPSLDDSDIWLQEKLSAMTWRKELLKLVIDEDMIRRFVVFTDNFAQGQLAYEHSPVVQPQTTFSAIATDGFTQENGQVWLWDEKATRRFSLYVDLLRSFDSESLVNWYMELKPLIDQAYSELGYEDNDFTTTLQEAINRVLDMEIPKQPLEIIQPSVMYRFKDPKIEALDDADKLLLRLGKENLLVMKSVLLEISEKIARQNAEN
jgi:DUF3014 family protein